MHYKLQVKTIRNMNALSVELSRETCLGCKKENSLVDFSSIHETNKLLLGH